jgi:hypothetical protein
MNDQDSATIRAETLGAEQKVERIQEAPAHGSSLATHEESLFIQPNDYWTIRYQGHVALIKSTRGLHYLAVLLRDPGREFHVRELLAHPLDASAPSDGWTLFRIPSVGRSGEGGVQTPDQRTAA